MMSPAGIAGDIKKLLGPAPGDAAVAPQQEGAPAAKPDL